MSTIFLEEVLFSCVSTTVGMVCHDEGANREVDLGMTES